MAASLVSFLCVMLPALSWLANFSWFVGVITGALFYRILALRAGSRASSALMAPVAQGSTEEA
jgi:cytosine/uracil/thiamine/allantoin permease